MRGSINNKGFSLIEVCIVLVIAGLVMGPLLAGYNLWRAKKAMADTTAHLAAANSALTRFARQNGHYPLPAARNQTASDIGFGKALALASVPIIPNCSPGGGDIIVCKTVGYRDLDGTPGNDPVYIGDIPFSTLGLPEAFITDGYGGKLTYAISGAMVDPVTFGEDKGSIRVIDNRLLRDNKLNGFDRAHFVVISHGPDNKGAFSRAAVLTAPCTTVPGHDTENCDNDAEFQSNFDYHVTETGTDYLRLQNDLPGTDFFDDYLGMSISTQGDVWQFTPSNVTDIYSRASGNIRIGPLTSGYINTDGSPMLSGGVQVPFTQVPLVKTEVMGNLRATELHTPQLCAITTGTMNTNAASTTYGGVYCNSTTTKPVYNFGYFAPGVIGGPLPAADAYAGLDGSGINCGTNEPITGITNVDEVCNFKSVSNRRIQASSFTVVTCVAGTFPIGTNASGDFVCSP